MCQDGETLVLRIVVRHPATTMILIQMLVSPALTIRLAAFPAAS
jgi:hypothetical protein